MHSDNEMVNLRSVIEALLYMVDEDSDGVEEVMQLPTIDLVRCKECKWGKPYSDKQLECDALGLGGLKFPDDFCSYGEREGE